MKLLTDHNYEEVFKEMNAFIEAIPKLAKLYGVLDLLNDISMNKNTYYNKVRTNSWSVNDINTIYKQLKQKNII